MQNFKIKSVYCREIFSDRGYPAIEATVFAENGASGTAACTAGVSVGSHEVAFSYDGGSRFCGKGVKKAVQMVDEIIAPAVLGMDVTGQAQIDKTLLALNRREPGGKIAGNAMAAVSAAVLKAGAAAIGEPLYRYIGGEDAVTLPLASYGCYFGSTRYGSVQKAGVKPTCAFVAYDFPSFSEASYALMKLSYAWRDAVYRKFGLRPCAGKGDVICAGFVLVPPGHVNNDMELWELAAETIEKTGFGGRIGLQIDIAADSFYDPEAQLYHGIFSRENKTREQMIDITKRMSEEFPFVVIEDPLHENDYEGFAVITRETGIQIVGDDLFTTDSARVRQGAAIGAGNAVLMKVNQIGTISQAMEMVNTAYEHDYGVMPCNSRGEGLDIVDYCVGINAATIRECSLGNFGNRLLRIEQELGSRARYCGRRGLKGRKFQTEGNVL